MTSVGGRRGRREKAKAGSFWDWIKRKREGHTLVWHLWGWES